MLFPKNLLEKLQQRKQNHAFRELTLSKDLIDFASNDYLGFAKSESLFEQTQQFLRQNNWQQNGATGSRLISGHHAIFEITEKKLADFHGFPTALLFNSGYDANVGFFGCVPQRHDIVLFDALCHASIRDGIAQGNAKSFKFEHNDWQDLERMILKIRATVSNSNLEIYVVTESIFSMDGDAPNLLKMAEITQKYDCKLVVDEAHAVGVFGKNGQGLCFEYGIQKAVFAQIVTFGKAVGCHGAAILGSLELKEYLTNFARSFIYTTALPPYAIATILTAYSVFEKEAFELLNLRKNILYFNQKKANLGLKPLFVMSKSAIQSAIIPGNENVKLIAKSLINNGFDVKAILSPTVPAEQERLRICLHSYNTEAQINFLIQELASHIQLL